MHFVVLGFNHKHTPLEIREALAFDREAAARVGKKLLEQEVISECLILCTCNRTELYAVGSCVEGVKETVYNIVSENTSCERGELSKASYSYDGTDAIKHLFRVSSSLDAMVVGESQILGQIKESYQWSSEENFVGPYLHKIFHSAFRVAKRVRTETDIAAKPVSVGTLAVDLIEEVAGELGKLNVLVIGAGEMSSLVASHLRERGAGHIWVANRTHSSAESLVAKVGGVLVPFDSWRVHLETADVVVSSVGGGILIREEDIKGTVQHIIIDLAVPRNVDESVKRLAHVKLFNIDDLQGLADKNISARQEAAAKAEELVAAEATMVSQELQYVRLAPVLTELQKKCNAAVQEGLKKLYSENPGWTDKEKESAKLCVESIARKILHDPIKLAKEEMVRPGAGGAEVANLIQNLLNI